MQKCVGFDISDDSDIDSINKIIKTREFQELSNEFMLHDLQIGVGGSGQIHTVLPFWEYALTTKEQCDSDALQVLRPQTTFAQVFLNVNILYFDCSYFLC